MYSTHSHVRTYGIYFIHPNRFGYIEKKKGKIETLYADVPATYSEEKCDVHLLQIYIKYCKNVLRMIIGIRCILR